MYIYMYVYVYIYIYIYINNIENISQGSGWEGSIRSYSDFIHKIGVTLRALCALM